MTLKNIVTVSAISVWMTGLAPAIPASADPLRPAPDLPPHTKMALKLAGLVTFVAGSCPQLSPDYAKFKSAIGALGVNVEDLKQDAMKTSYLGYAAQYQSDIKANCERARLQFGPKGATLPDLFAVQ